MSDTATPVDGLDLPALSKSFALKIATWNVNSIRHRFGHLVSWLDEEKPDIVTLQETKCPDDQFPFDELAAVGYQGVIHGEKGYNGVAIFYQGPQRASDVCKGIPGFVDGRCRVMAATVANLRIISVYAVSGQGAGSERFDYKLRWLKALRDYLYNEFEDHPDLVVAGDFNVAPTNDDLHHSVQRNDEILSSAQERSAYAEILNVGLQDAFRLFPQSPSTYTWWRNGRTAFANNIGLRIDHILVTPSLALRCRNCLVTTNPRRQWRPSDHAPVLAYFG